jgi:hypothetical protein
VIAGATAYAAGVRGWSLVLVAFAIFLPVVVVVAMADTKLFGLRVTTIDHGTISRLGEYED